MGFLPGARRPGMGSEVGRGQSRRRTSVLPRHREPGAQAGERAEAGPVTATSLLITATPWGPPPITCQ